MLQAGPQPGSDFRGRTLTVFVYSGLDKLFREHFVEPFEAKTGATVVLDAGWWDSIGKLKASPKGQPAYDLVLTAATQGYPAIKSGMFRQIDFDKVPNHKALAPVALDNWVTKARYGVTFHESAMTLVWDRRQVNTDPTGWGYLLRDDFRGRLALYDSFYMSLYTFACVRVSAEGKAGTADQALTDDLGAVLDFARRERDRVRVLWPTGTKMVQDLLQGTFAAGTAGCSPARSPSRSIPRRHLRHSTTVPKVVGTRRVPTTFGASTQSRSTVSPAFGLIVAATTFGGVLWKKHADPCPRRPHTR